jgi:hypothetical protein
LYKKKLEQNTKLKQAKVELVTFNTLIKQFYKKKTKGIFGGESWPPSTLPWFRYWVGVGRV